MLPWKKELLTLLMLSLLFVLAGCGIRHAEETEAAGATPAAVRETETEPASPTPQDAGGEAEADADLMSHSDFLAAEEDSPVTVECFVQAKDAWNDGLCSLYAQDEEGAYYLPRLRCSQSEYEKLEIGRKIRVKGYKGHWNDSVEIAEASFQLLDGKRIAEARDVTAMIGTDELSLHQNEKVCFRGMTIEAMPDGTSVWYYGWDNSAPAGEETERYFRASCGGTVCDFTVKPALCPNAEEVLQTLQRLQVGDRVDLTGFLRFYNGALPRITEIAPADGF